MLMRVGGNQRASSLKVGLRNVPLGKSWNLIIESFEISICALFLPAIRREERE
jgi:hypothetical protein